MHSYIQIQYSQIGTNALILHIYLHNGIHYFVQVLMRVAQMQQKKCGEVWYKANTCTSSDTSSHNGTMHTFIHTYIYAYTITFLLRSFAEWNQCIHIYMNTNGIHFCVEALIREAQNAAKIVWKSVVKTNTYTTWVARIEQKSVV